jgi:hypothetical protein
MLSDDCGTYCRLRRINWPLVQNGNEASALAAIDGMRPRIAARSGGVADQIKDLNFTVPDGLSFAALGNRNGCDPNRVAAVKVADGIRQGFV